MESSRPRVEYVRASLSAPSAACLPRGESASSVTAGDQARPALRCQRRSIVSRRPRDSQRRPRRPYCSTGMFHADELGKNQHPMSHENGLAGTQRAFLFTALPGRGDGPAVPRQLPTPSPDLARSGLARQMFRLSPSIVSCQVSPLSSSDNRRGGDTSRASSPGVPAA